MRTFQNENIVRRVSFGVAAAVPDAGFIFTQRDRRNIRAVLDVRRQLRRNAARRTVRGAGLTAPGWMEIISQRTERYSKLHAREVFDVRDVFRERFGVTPPPPDVGYVQPRLHPGPVVVPIRAVQAKPVVQTAGLSEIRFRIAKLQRAGKPKRHIYVVRTRSYGVAAPVPDVSHVFKRVQRSVLFEIREFRKARRLRISMGVGVAAPGFEIGWMVSYIIRRAYGHNLRR